MLKKLSARQEKMLRFIDGYVSAKNYPPSIREIGDAVELKSSSTVKGHLAGYVTCNLGTGKTSDIECGEKKRINSNEIKCLVYKRSKNSMKTVLAPSLAAFFL